MVSSVILLAACSGDAGITDESAPLRPSFSGFPPAQTVSLPLSSEFETTAYAPLPSFPTTTLVSITASGTITAYKNYPPAEYGELFAVIPPTGYWSTNCRVQLVVYYPWVNRAFGECGAAAGPVVMLALANMPGQVMRNVPIVAPTCGYYPHQPCHYYEGGAQTVTVAVVPADLMLTVNRYVVVPGKTVSFRARVKPDSVAGILVPRQVQQWRYVPDSGAAFIPPCGAGPVCNYTPTVSGTMFVDALVNGSSQTRSVHVRVLCEPTGDPLLDSLPVLDGLKAAWDSSNANGPGVDRRERYFTVQCDEFGCTYSVVPGDPSDTPCQAQPPGMDATGTRRSGGHIHPFTPGPGVLPASELKPSNCGGIPSTPQNPLGTAPWPSSHDYEHAAGPGGGLPHYVMDRNSIYAIPAGLDTAITIPGTKTIPRKKNGCQRV